MNKDQVTGKIDQAVGKVEQSIGETVGSQKLANKGVVKQAKGAAKETWGDANAFDVRHEFVGGLSCGLSLLVFREADGGVTTIIPLG